jgi:(S)-3,5-dihydroxyphenylglycine transaminase
MNFLNEVVLQFPDAISFAPGRPSDALLHVEEHLEDIERYVEAMASAGRPSTRDVWRSLGQYGRTNGIIGEAVAAHLALDEDIHVSPDSIVVTVGAQEAMAIVLMGLFDGDRDVLLVSDPTYIGITGLAEILGIRIVPIGSGRQGLEPAAVERAIVATSQRGRVRALYDIPDFNNPLGTSMPIDARRALIDLCERHDILVIEDNAYGMFAYDEPRLPTLKSLDRTGRVLYIGSFAKTLAPGLRVGYLVADQRVTGDQTLAHVLSKVKSLTTVNTSPLLQAAVAGALLRGNGTLESLVAPKRSQYRRQRDAMLAALDDAFDGGRGDVTWHKPAGGFFIPVMLPFEFGPNELRTCAQQHGVIVCPMRFFHVARERGLTEIRLSFSTVGPEQSAAGVRRLAEFVGRSLSSAPATGERGTPSDIATEDTWRH